MPEIGHFENMSKFGAELTKVVNAIVKGLIISISVKNILQCYKNCVIEFILLLFYLHKAPIFYIEKANDFQQFLVRKPSYL